MAAMPIESWKAVDCSGSDGGGRGGIRTHEGLAPLAVFKTAALNRSATLPANEIKHLARLLCCHIRQLAPDWHPACNNPFSFCPTQRPFHSIGGAVIRLEHMAVDAERDRRRAM